MTPVDLLARIKPGVCATLWTPGPMSETLTPRVMRILDRAKPQITCLHGVPSSHRTAAKGVWSHLSGLEWKPRLWLGVACDTEIALAAHGHQTPLAAVNALAVSADVAADLGAELVMWNSEAASMISPAIAASIAGLLIQQVRQKHPQIVQGHTSYGRVTNFPYKNERGEMLLHGYPWPAWCGDHGVDVEFLQNYAAPEDPGTGVRPIAGPGALKNRLLKDGAAWDDAVIQGWVRKDLVRWPYLQLHHVPYGQTATYGTDPQKIFKPGPGSALGHVWAGWTVEKNRCDEDGEIALCVGADLHRRGQSVSEFQASQGLSPDGIVGPLTIAAMGLK